MDRAYSNYTDRVNRGTELTSFHEVVKNELKFIKKIDFDSKNDNQNLCTFKEEFNLNAAISVLVFKINVHFFVE